MVIHSFEQNICFCPLATPVNKYVQLGSVLSFADGHHLVDRFTIRNCTPYFLALKTVELFFYCIQEWRCSNGPWPLARTALITNWKLVGGIASICVARAPRLPLYLWPTRSTKAFFGSSSMACAGRTPLLNCGTKVHDNSTVAWRQPLLQKTFSLSLMFGVYSQLSEWLLLKATCGCGQTLVEGGGCFHGGKLRGQSYASGAGPNTAAGPRACRPLQQHTACLPSIAQYVWPTWAVSWSGARSRAQWAFHCALLSTAWTHARRDATLTSVPHLSMTSLADVLLVIVAWI